MNKSRLCLLLAALLICSTFTLGGTSASTHHHDNHNGKQNQSDFLITIDQNDGDIFTQSLNLSGNSNIPPTGLSWKILDIGDNRGTEIVMESSYFSEIQYNDGIWNWYINETIEDIFCTCILKITNFYEENTTLEATMLLFSLLWPPSMIHIGCISGNGLDVADFHQIHMSMRK